MNKEYYESRYKYDSKRTTIWKTICKFLQRYIRKDSVILDLGCGYCDFINNINASEKHAVDLSSMGKEHAKKDVTFNQTSSTKLSYKKDFFDVVFCSNFFEHLNNKDLEKTISEVSRVLKPCGILMVLQPNYRYCVKEYFDDYTHQLVFTHLSFKNFLEANGFKIKHCKKRLLPFSVSSGILIPRFLLPLLINLYLVSPVRPWAKQMFIIAENDK